MLFALVVTLITMCACTTKQLNNKYSINGTVEADSLNGKYVYLFSSIQNMDSAIARAEIKNNKFHICNNILVHPYSAPLVVGEPDGSLIKPYLGSTIVLETGNINVNIQSSGVTRVSGTPLNDMFHQCEFATIKYDSLVTKLNRSNLNSEAKRKSLDSLKINRANHIYDALIDYTNWEVTKEVLNLTYLHLFSHQLVDINLRTHTEIKNKSTYPPIKNAIKTAVGEQFIDVNLNTIEGQATTLSKYIGNSKYTLVEFWASWCGPCIRTIPKLKEIYNNTDRDTFNIVAISFDKNYENWKSSVDKLGISWPQLSSLNAWECISAETYGICFIPSTILINKSGCIVARNPSIDEMEIYLE